MLSLSTSRLGVTFLCPSVGGNLLFVHGFLFLGKATLFAQGISDPHSLCSGIGGNSAYSLYIPECVEKGLKRKESVASEDLQHSLFVLVQNWWRDAWKIRRFSKHDGRTSEEDSNHSHKKKMVCGRTIPGVLTFSAKQSQRFWPFAVFRQQQERSLRLEDSGESKDDGGKKQELAR